VTYLFFKKLFDFLLSHSSKWKYHGRQEQMGLTSGCHITELFD